MMRQARIKGGNWHNCKNVTHAQAAAMVATAWMKESKVTKAFVETRDSDAPDVHFKHEVSKEVSYSVNSFRGD